MVKFSKQLERQLVPEWKHAFCNYSQLKKYLKQIKLSIQQPRNSVSHPHPSISAFSINDLTRRRNVQKDAIKVHMRRSNQYEEYYETELVEPMVEEEVERAFFARLDEELNKINRFYMSKEQEYVQKTEEVKLQLERLITLRKVLKVQQGLVVELGDLLSEQGIQDESLQELGFGISDSPSSGTKSNNSSPIHKIEFNLPKSTPIQSISETIQILWNDVKTQMKWRQFSRLDKKKVQYAEKMLRNAFVEHYRALGLLRSFSSLNMVAFAKILKKYDKITRKKASTTYMKVVEGSYFNASNKVINTMDELEKMFTEYFASGDHKKAMSFLRPLQHSASHKVTFFLGIFIGCSIAFLVAFIVYLHMNGLDKKFYQFDGGNNSYMNSVFPIFSFLSLLVLHLYMYGWNLFLWREKRINYAFIFEFGTNSELKYREVLMIASALTTLILGGLFAHVMAYTSLVQSFNTNIIPLIILLIVLVLLICPVNICYRSSRYFFLSSMKRIIISPLYKVIMVDFFLADQLTSQVFLFRNAEYIMCYFVTSRLKWQSNEMCSSQNVNFATFAYLLSLLPYWWRLMQCLRRWQDEHDKMHLANGGKYFSAMVAAAVALTYHNYQTTGWMLTFISFSSLATCYQLYWDFIVDWGLLQTKSKNYLLRDQLVLENKNIYFMSMGLNFILRLAWLQSLTRLHFLKVDRRVADFFFASLEVIRRGHWNFYRLENEHLNNVGKFRAVKAVPLPFRYVEEDA